MGHTAVISVTLAHDADVEIRHFLLGGGTRLPESRTPPAGRLARCAGTRSSVATTLGDESER